ncbi:oligosaccharide flippase family protein [Nevskia soli]|uniref:oligosaccharide flippase family protein n=1 Tax=Nevskia soli TaxID=418856 RepID=UPI0015D7A3BF|nr:oligosaccharide flippase family protein [Nevskia soli]
MARSRHFAHSVLLAFAGQAIIMSAGLWLTPFLLGKLGVLRYGVWILGQQFLTYMTMLDFGVVALLPREIAYAEGRKSVVAGPVARTARLLVLQTPIAGAIAISLAFILTRNATPHAAEMRPAALIAAVAFTVLFPFRAARAICEGLQDLGYIGTAYLIAWAVGFAVTVAAITRGAGIAALALGWATMQATEAALCASRVWLRWRHAIPSWRLLRSPAPAGERLARGMWISVSQISQVLIYGTDSVIVGKMFGAAAIVPYSCTGKLINVLSNQPQHIMRAAEPGLSQMRMSESRARLASVTNALSLAMLLASGLVVTVCLAVNPAFVQWWVGGKYFSGFGLTLLFSLSMVLRHLNITAIYTLFAFGHEKLLAMTSLADGVLSTALSILFALLLHSPAGIVLGSIASTCCVLGFANGRKLSAELAVRQRDLYKPLAGWFWRMVLVGFGAYVVSGLGPAKGFVAIAMMGCAAAAAYAGIMLPVALRSSLEPYLRPVLSRFRWRTVRVVPVENQA